MKKLLFILQIFIVFTTGILAKDWYVRPAGGSYGAEDGTSYANAWDGLPNVKWGSGGVQPGDTLWVCGLHLLTATNLGDVGQNHLIFPISGTSESARVTIRGDYPSDPGIIWGAYKIAYSGWTYEGNNTWSISVRSGHQPDWVFQDVTANSWVVLTMVSSIDQCKSTPGSHYFGDRLYVHCSDNGNPTGRICANSFGYIIRVGYQNKQYITIKNLKFYQFNCGIWGDETPSHLRWEGCVFAYAGSDMFYFMTGSDYMEVVNCDLSWAKNGIMCWELSDQNKTGPRYFTLSGNVIHDIGVRPSQQNGDAHGIWVNGGVGGIIEDNEIYNCGSGITFYTLGGQVSTNNTIRRNYCYNMHTYGGANGRGIELNVGSEPADQSGNKIYQNIVANCPSVGIRVQYKDEVEVYNNVVINCSYSFYSSRTGDGGYGPNIKARNNISVNPTVAHIHFDTQGTIYACNYDYNLYYPDGSTFFRFKSGTYRNFSGWQSLSAPNCLFDPHSKLGNPLFVDAPNSNFQLQSSSPAIDAGINVGLSRDRVSTLIPQGFAPDIGAYECKKTIFCRLYASPSSGSPPFIVNFSAEAMGDYPPFSFKWDFGDGQSNNSQDCSHTYIGTGTYTASLTVTDSQGNKETQSIVIHAYTTYRLSLSANTGSPAPGAGGTTNPAPGTHHYQEGTTVNLSASPYINYRFSQWTGDIISSEIYKQDMILTIDRDKMVAANFCTKCGDVNGDLMLTPADAQAAFDIFLGKIQNSTLCQKENADVNADGTKSSPRITPMDAQLIFGACPKVTG